MKTPGASRPSISVQSTSKSKFKLGFGKDKSATSTSAQEGADEVVPELRRYLADEVLLHNALAHKWLGVDASEHGGSQQSGVAVGFLSWAHKELEDLKGGASGVNIGVVTERERDMREERKARVQAEADSVSVFLKGYKRMNDSV